jgi:hypothetical protein
LSEYLLTVSFPHRTPSEAEALIQRLREDGYAFEVRSIDGRDPGEREIDE